MFSREPEAVCKLMYFFKSLSVHFFTDHLRSCKDLGALLMSGLCFSSAFLLARCPEEGTLCTWESSSVKWRYCDLASILPRLTAGISETSSYGQLLCKPCSPLLTQVLNSLCSLAVWTVRFERVLAVLVEGWISSSFSMAILMDPGGMEVIDVLHVRLLKVELPPGSTDTQATGAAEASRFAAVIRSLVHTLGWLSAVLGT